MLHKAWNSKGEMPYCFPRSFIKFQGHTVQNITDFDPNWAFPDYRPVAAFKSLRFALLSFENVKFDFPCLWWSHSPAGPGKPDGPAGPVAPGEPVTTAVTKQTLYEYGISLLKKCLILANVLFSSVQLQKSLISPLPHSTTRVRGQFSEHCTGMYSTRE